MTREEIASIVDSVTYKPGWKVVVGDWHTRPFIQVYVSTQAEASICSLTMERVAWKSGKRYLSYHMCRQEVVGAIFDLIKGAETHEVHEWFRYKGASIYNPHIDPDVLVKVAKKAASFCVRDNAMSMEE